MHNTQKTLLLSTALAGFMAFQIMLPSHANAQEGDAPPSLEALYGLEPLPEDEVPDRVRMVPEEDATPSFLTDNTADTAPTPTADNSGEISIEDILRATGTPEEQAPLAQSPEPAPAQELMPETMAAPSLEQSLQQPSREALTTPPDLAEEMGNEMPATEMAAPTALPEPEPAQWPSWLQEDEPAGTETLAAPAPDPVPTQELAPVANQQAADQPQTGQDDPATTSLESLMLGEPAPSAPSAPQPGLPSERLQSAESPAAAPEQLAAEPLVVNIPSQQEQAAAEAELERAALLEDDSSVSIQRDNLADTISEEEAAMSQGLALEMEPVAQEPIVVASLPFMPHHSALSLGLKRQLDQIAEQIKNDGGSLELHGYADMAAKGNLQTTKRISENRAQTVRQYLVARGVGAGRIAVQAKGMDFTPGLSRDRVDIITTPMTMDYAEASAVDEQPLELSQ